MRIWYGFCASAARPAGHGRPGLSAAQRCTCESTISIEALLWERSYRGALSRRSSYGAEYEKPLMWSTHASSTRGPMPQRKASS